MTPQQLSLHSAVRLRRLTEATMTEKPQQKKDGSSPLDSEAQGFVA
jgi:hypothetical protein